MPLSSENFLRKIKKRGGGGLYVTLQFLLILKGFPHSCREYNHHVFSATNNNYHAKNTATRHEIKKFLSFLTVFLASFLNFLSNELEWGQNAPLSKVMLVIYKLCYYWKERWYKLVIYTAMKI